MEAKGHFRKQRQFIGGGVACTVQVTIPTCAGLPGPVLARPLEYLAWLPPCHPLAGLQDPTTAEDAGQPPHAFSHQAPHQTAELQDPAFAPFQATAADDADVEYAEREQHIALREDQTNQAERKMKDSEQEGACNEATPRRGWTPRPTQTT